MERSRTQNSINNIIFGAINRMISIIFPFIVRTIFIKTLGEEYLGLNSLFSSVLQVLNLADLGFSSAIVASMYKPIADNDVGKISALMNLYRKIYRIIGFSILGVGIILTPFISLVINGEPPGGVNIYLLWLLYLANTVVSYLLFSYKISVLNAHQRNDITEKIGAISRILISILQIYVVSVLNSIYLYVSLTILSSIIYNAWCAYECDKRYPQYSCKGELDSITKKTISKNIGALTIQKIGNTVSLSLDAIIISAFLGLTTVAIYGNYFYVISAISIFISMLYSAITASIGNSIATETPEKNYFDFKKIFFLNTWLIGWCCVCFMVIFQDFMTIWMGEDLLFGFGIVFSIVMRFFFEQVRKVVLTYKDAAGMWQKDKWRPLVGCIVNLILNIALVKSVGVIGVKISTIFSYALIELPWETHTLFKHYFKRSVIEYYRAMIFCTVTMALAGGVTYLICSMLPISGMLTIAVKLLICIVLPNLLFVLFNLKNTDFLNSLDILKRVQNNMVKKLNKA